MANEEQFKRLEKSIEKFAQTVSEEIADVREEIGGLRQEMQNGFTAVGSKVDGVHQRLDEELDKRKQLDVKVTRIEKKVFPETARS